VEDRVELLKFCPVLKGFTDVGFQILAAVTRPRVYRNAQVLQAQGEVPKDAGVLFLSTGRVRCEVRDSEGKSLGLGSLGPGDHLGGLRLFGELPSPITVTAEGDIAGLLIDREAYGRLRQQKPQAATKLLLALTDDFGQRLAESGPLFADFAQFAARRANLAERGTYASYSDMALDLTPQAQKTGSRG